MVSEEVDRKENETDHGNYSLNSIHMVSSKTISECILTEWL